MAARESVNNYDADVEAIVNRWLVDYYMLLSLELFQSEKYQDFCAVREVLESVLRRPWESTDVLRAKLWALKFLSRINEGENLDLLFETDSSITPLESAIMLLEGVNTECTLPRQEITRVITSVKEMLMVICIKKGLFEKARAVLKQYPKGSKKAIFTDLIGKKRRKHAILEKITFQGFKKEMLEFCQKMWPRSVPLLYKAAKQLKGQRVGTEEQGDGQDASPPDDQGNLQITIEAALWSNQIFIERTRVEAAYTALTAGSDAPTFAQLEDEMESEYQREQRNGVSIEFSITPSVGTNVEPQLDDHIARDSGSPLEADQAPVGDTIPCLDTDAVSHEASPPRTTRQHTVSQLVIEPDSQESSQCSATSREPGIEVIEEDHEFSLHLSDEDNQQSPSTDTCKTKCSQKRPRLPRKAHHKCPTSSSINEDNNMEPSAAKRKCTPKKKSIEMSEDTENPLGTIDAIQPPVRRPRTRQSCSLTSESLERDGEAVIEDSSLDCSPPLSRDPTPQKSSTPQKLKQDHGKSKWRQLCNAAMESRAVWSDEETVFNSKSNNGNEVNASFSGHKKRRWTAEETQMLREGVKKFGEGSWSKIKSYYSFNDRTNVNLKDRWRTMKNLNLT